MMNHRKARMGKSHDFGLPAVAGKGDANRVADLKTFNANFSEIAFKHDATGFQKVGHKSIKTYGPVRAEKEFTHFDAVDWCGANEPSKGMTR